MNPVERRQRILERLCCRRYDTCGHLADEFHVSIKTIQRDIKILICVYPIETVRGRFGGGIRVMDGYYFTYKPSDRKALNQQQIAVLRELREEATGKKRDVLDSILVQFAP